jgi:hypothetical protein
LENSTRAAIFETRAGEREAELQSLWRSASPTANENGFEPFRAENTSRVFQFKGRDLSDMEATPDFLVDIGVGLWVFLKSAKGTDVLPNKALDNQNKPAKMAYGRAIAMFGAPVGPGRDDEPDEGVPLEKELQKLNLTDPMTEHKWRRGDGDYPFTNTELLNEPAQWQLFLPHKLLQDTHLLARQYCHTVALAKKKAEEDRQAEAAKSANQSSVSPLSTSSPPKGTEASIASKEATPLNSNWPPPEEQDWVGFTNWITRCKKTDPKFGAKFVVPWTTARQARVKDLQNGLMKWSPPETFDDGRARFPEPTQFYKGPNIDHEDAKKLGLKVK